MSDSNNNISDEATAIVLDTPNGSLSAGTERVIRDRVEQVVNTGDSDESVSKIRVTTIGNIRGDSD